MMYDIYMPHKGQKTTINEDGVEKPAYTIAFTNGALEELEQLQKKLGAPDLDSVVKVAIGILSHIEERNHGRTQPKVS